MDRTQLPQHVGIIMDGNGRWAKKRGLPRTAGHAAGAGDLPHHRLLLPGHWHSLPDGVCLLHRELEAPGGGSGHHHGPAAQVPVRGAGKDGAGRVPSALFGNLEPLPPALRDLCLRAEETAASLSGKRHQVNICLNYGGRDEILRAAQAWGRDLLAGRQTVEDLTDEAFSRYLDSRGMPDPDLIIRPSGELRLSNFLTWQSAYAGVLFYRCALARFYPPGPGRGLGGVSAAPAPVWRRITVRNRILVACVGVPVILVVLFVLPGGLYPCPSSPCCR